MAMSKKLTFSLASLVVLFGLVFATAPAMAQAVDVVGDLGDATDAGDDDIDVTGDIIPANGHLVLFKGADAATSGLPTLPPNGAVFCTVGNDA